MRKVALAKRNQSCFCSPMLIQCEKYGLLIVLIILMRQEFLHIRITINLAYIQVLNLAQGLQESRIAYNVVILGSVSILIINI